jgi:hypothetical protein
MLISHAPQTPYLTLDPGLFVNYCSPGYYGSYLAIMAQVGSLIDFLNVQAYNNCGAQDCPIGAAIVNNLLSDAPTPPILPPIYGGGPSPTLTPTQVVYGQLVPLQAACPGTTSPATQPWCRGNGNMNPGIGCMFWLNDNGDGPAADAVVDTWFPPATLPPGALSPPLRVVYYLNGPGTYTIPETGYSRSNTIIIGFIYPAANTGNTGNTFACPPGSKQPAWACFGFYYSFGVGGEPLVLVSPAYVQSLITWRAVEPTRRKIMVGFGGAVSVPLYDTWAQGNNAAVVAAGLVEFFTAFEATNGFALDGVDFDYEDSTALATHKGPLAVQGANAGAAIRSAALLQSAKKAATTSFVFGSSSTGAIVAAVACALVVLYVVVAVCVPQVRAGLRKNPGLMSTVIVAAVACATALVALSAPKRRGSCIYTYNAFRE